MKKRMNSFTRRDEFKNRLSSFLFEEGNLSLETISSIKSSVFLIQTDKKENLVLKRHNRKENVNLQWDFFDEIGESNAISFKKYPNGRKIISRNNYYWTITPYIQGEKLNYKLAADRLEAVKTLKKFHHKAKDIHIHNSAAGDDLFTRWYQRLLLFKKTASIFKEYGFENLYKDIVQTTVILLRLMTQFPLKSYEMAAKGKVCGHMGMLLHITFYETGEQMSLILIYCSVRHSCMITFNWGNVFYLM